MQGYDDYRGVFMKDQVPTLKAGEGVIVNLDSSTGPGTHWVCWYHSKDGDYRYFDPFGNVPPLELSKVGDSYYSDLDVQPIDSTKCGYYSTVVLKDLLNGKSLIDSLKQFSAKPKKNDSWVNKK